MSDNGNLLNFGAHRKAVELFNFVVADLGLLRTDFTLTRLIKQQLVSSDSIAANIEEGYGPRQPQGIHPVPHHCARLRPRNSGPLSTL